LEPAETSDPSIRRSAKIGDRTNRSRGAGWEFLFVAVDDCAPAVHPDERKDGAIAPSPSCMLAVA